MDQVLTEDIKHLILYLCMRFLMMVHVIQEEGDCEPILKNHSEIDGFMELFTMEQWQGVNPFK